MEPDPKPRTPGESTPGTRACDLCGSPRGKPSFRVRDYLTGDRFDILRCSECGLLRTDFRGSPDDLAGYYGPSYYGVRGRRFLSVLERTVGGFRRFRALRVARAIGRPGRVLDLGCGRGLMLSALREMGWECVGTEISEQLAEEARRAHGIRVLVGNSEQCPLPCGSFDAVTAWHSLEHALRPARVLKEAVRLLGPDGLLMVEVPNAESLQARMGGAGWFHFDAPRHLYHFGRRDLRALMESLGLEILSEGTLSLEQGPFGMVQSLLNRVTFAPNVLYRLIRRAGGGGRAKPADSVSGLRGWWDVAVTLLFAVPFGALGALLEMGACAVGRGGVIRCVARKRPAVG